MVCSEQLGISFVLLQPTFTLSILLSVIHYLAGGAGPGLLMVRVIYRVFCVWNPKYLLGLKTISLPDLFVFPKTVDINSICITKSVSTYKIRILPNTRNGFGFMICWYL